MAESPTVDRSDCAQRCSLQGMPPFKPLSHSYVAPATRPDGMDLVLKLRVPDLALLTEIEALRLPKGHGAAQLLDADPDRGILLLERLKPATPLSSIVDDGQATSIAVRVMRQLWTPVPPTHPFPTVVE
jgi:streptomycin 6-kinase